MAKQLMGLSFSKKDDSVLINNAKQKFVTNLIDYLEWNKNQSKQYRAIVEKTLDATVDSFSIKNGKIFVDIGYTGNNFEKADNCINQILKDLPPKQFKEFQTISLYTISYLETVCSVHANRFTEKLVGKNSLDSWNDMFQHSWNFYKSWQSLLETETMIYVENFSEKFLYYDISKKDIEQLNSFLSYKGVDLSLYLLRKFVEQTQFSIKRNRLDVWIEAKNPKIFEDYLGSFLEFFGEKSAENLDMLEMLLKQKNISYNGSLSDALFHHNKELEMEEYAQSLKEPYSPNPFSINAIDSMSKHEFETFLKHLFEKMGFDVELAGDDNILISKLGQKTIVKAKQSMSPIPIKAVLEITDAIKQYSAYDGMVVSSNDFPPSEIKTAHSNGIELISRSKLNSWITTYLSE
jgi:hypothetical protein